MSNNNESNSSMVPVDAIKPASMELEAVRGQLAAAKGPKYWRTLEELSEREIRAERDLSGGGHGAETVVGDAGTGQRS